jgi:hypothetical protein
LQWINARAVPHNFVVIFHIVKTTTQPNRQNNGKPLPLIGKIPAGLFRFYRTSLLFSA